MDTTARAEVAHPRGGRGGHPGAPAASGRGSGRRPPADPAGQDATFSARRASGSLSRTGVAMLLGTMLVLGTACAGAATGADGSSPPEVITAVIAADASVPFGQSPPASVTLAATVVGTGVVDAAVTWELEPGLEGCGPLGASVTQDGLFTAPTSSDTSVGGSCKVIAKAVFDPTKTGISSVTITAAPAVPPTPPPPVTPPGAVLAFPGAQGGGSLSSGGRGGTVYAVTNLNDSGTGSLRACVEAAGPRTCVFRVAGVINLTKGYLVTSPYLTVAGQSAPGDGIAINLATHTGSATTNPSAIFKILTTHDVVIRYLRLWGDYVVDQASSNIGTIAVNAYSSYNVMVDHCTMLWHSWEPVDLVGNTAYSSINGRIAVQDSLLGESVLSPVDSTPPPDSSPQAVGIQSQDINYNGTLFRDVDIHHNVLATAGHRMPGLNGSGRLVNNLIYNYHRATNIDSAGGASSYDVIGNYYKPGPFSRSADTMEIELTRGSGSVYVSGNKADAVGPPGPPAGRGAVTGLESDASQWTLLTGFSPVYQGAYTASGGAQPAPAGQMRTSPLAAYGSAIAVDAVSGLQASLLADRRVGMSRRLDCSGNWVNVSDSARDRILAYVVAGGGPPERQGSAAAYQGALPTLAAGSPCLDTDSDGIPDAYEDQNGLDKNNAADGQVIQADGYTNLEHYLDGR